MRFRRIATFFLTLVISSAWLIPSVAPQSIAYGQTLGQGYSVAGDFKGAGYQQIATLYDPNDNLGLRIVVLDRTTTDPKMVSTQWFLEAANSFDMGRMKVAALDLNADGKTDIAVLYNDGNNAVRLLSWISTGTNFAYQGNQGIWRHPNFDWQRAGDLLTGTFTNSGLPGILIPYAQDNFDLKFLYLEATPTGIRYAGDRGLYDSGPNQIWPAQARFVAGRFARPTGPDQVAMIYQYDDGSIKIHIFELDSGGSLAPQGGGFGGHWTSPPGFFDITKARFVAGDVDGDKRSDIIDFYDYPDGSSRVHLMLAADGHALRDVIGVAWPIGAMPWRYLAAVFFWGAASQALGAIQDIEFDRQARIGSIAVSLGARNTALLSVILYCAAAALVASAGGIAVAAAVALLPYPLLAASCKLARSTSRSLLSSAKRMTFTSCWTSATTTSGKA